MMMTKLIALLLVLMLILSIWDIWFRTQPSAPPLKRITAGAELERHLDELLPIVIESLRKNRKAFEKHDYFLTGSKNKLEIRHRQVLVIITNPTDWPNERTMDRYIKDRIREDEKSPTLGDVILGFEVID